MVRIAVKAAVLAGLTGLQLVQLAFGQASSAWIELQVHNPQPLPSLLRA
jgi:hypothetical protein